MMIFKKYAEMAVITISFVDSLFQYLYYVEIEMEYYFNWLINKI